MGRTLCIGRTAPVSSAWGAAAGVRGKAAGLALAAMITGRSVAEWPALIEAVARASASAADGGDGETEISAAGIPSMPGGTCNDTLTLLVGAATSGYGGISTPPETCLSSTIGRGTGTTTICPGSLAVGTAGGVDVCDSTGIGTGTAATRGWLPDEELGASREGREMYGCRGLLIPGGGR